MVSRIRYPHVFNQLFRGRRSFQHLVKLIFSMFIIAAVHELAIPLVLCYYVMASPLRALWMQIVRHPAAAASTTSGESIPPDQSALG
jgi:CDP-diacylglycerol--serine O-phosphatidyltransferase